MKYKYGIYLFNTKKDIGIFFSNLLQNKKTLNNDEKVALLELLKNHPNYDEKMKNGCKDIIILTNKYFIKTQSNKGFFILDNNNQYVDFSYRKCISFNPKQDINSAYRNAIANDIAEYRNSQLKKNNGNLICDITHEILTRQNTHIDHKEPITFSFIVNKFKKEYGESFEIIEIDGNKYFKDKKYEEQFRNFHNNIAILRILRKDLNLSSSKRHIAES